MTTKAPIPQPPHRAPLGACRCRAAAASWGPWLLRSEAWWCRNHAWARPRVVTAPVRWVAGGWVGGVGGAPCWCMNHAWARPRVRTAPANGACPWHLRSADGFRVLGSYSFSLISETLKPKPCQWGVPVASALRRCPTQSHPPGRYPPPGAPATTNQTTASKPANQSATTAAHTARRSTTYAPAASGQDHPPHRDIVR
jgi:hypothetical protein